MDLKQQVHRVKRYQREGKRLKYEAKILPFLDALCSGAATNRDALMQQLDITEDGILSLLANVTMAIQGKGKVSPMAEGGWYEGGPEGYRVNPEFAREWLASRGMNPIETGT
jgi:hypothetical protein